MVIQWYVYTKISLQYVYAFKYQNNPKYCNRQTWQDSVDPERY